jgi:hypothetical protein
MTTQPHPPDRPQGLEPRQYAVLERVTPEQLDDFEPSCTRCGDWIFFGDYQDPKTGHCIDCVGRGGSVLGWVAVAALVVVAMLAIAFVGYLAAPREADTSTAPQPGAPGLSGSVGSSAQAPASASRSPLPGAPRPAERPAVDGRGETPQPAGAPAPTGGIGSAMIGGLATHYDNGPGLYGAAGPLLREALGGDPAFRGQRVEVCADECVTVRLVDWCACGDRGGIPTIIDLSPQAFARLAPLTAGVIPVTIELGGTASVTLPPTDVAP